MFTKIDDWLFDSVFQPVTNWFTLRTGQSNFWLAATCAYLFGSLAIAQFLLIPSNQSYFFLALLLYFTIKMARNSYMADKNRTVSSTRNTRRINAGYGALRIFVNLMTVFITGNIFVNGFTTIMIVFFVLNLVLTSAIYFECCDTLPPPPPKRKTEVKVAPAA